MFNAEEIGTYDRLLEIEDPISHILGKQFFKLIDTPLRDYRTPVAVILNSKYSFYSVNCYHLKFLSKLISTNNNIQINEYINCDKPFKFHLDMDDVPNLEQPLFNYTKNIIAIIEKMTGVEAKYIITGSDDYQDKFHLIISNLIMPNGNTYFQFVETLQKAIEKLLGFDLLADKRHACYRQTKKEKHVSLRLLGSSKNGSRNKLIKHSNYTPASDDTFLSITEDIENSLTVPATKITKEKPKSNYEKAVNTELDKENVIEILNLLSHNRFVEYLSWRTLIWICCKAGLDHEIIHDYSALGGSSYCYDSTERLINGYIKCENTMGTLYFMLKEDVDDITYKIIYDKHNKNIEPGLIAIPIDDIHADEVINQNNIGSYLPRLEKHKGIFVRSNCMTYKTQQIKPLLEHYKKVLIITFRKTLADSYDNEFQDFVNYQDLNTKTYKADRLIIQIDSLHKVRGEYDLLFFDEFEYTGGHLVSFCKEKRFIMDALQQFTKACKKYLVTDALLSQATIDFFKRIDPSPITVVENNYKSFSNTKAKLLGIGNNCIVKYVVDQLELGMKIVIPSNSKAKANELYDIICRKFNGTVKVALITSETDIVPVGEWVNYDVVIYSPTIVAGNSFNEKHFDELVGYYTSNSCNAEIFLQMLLRTRNIKSNSMTIFYESKVSYLPSTPDEVDTYLMNKDHILQTETGLSINLVKNRINKNNYYYLYRHNLVRDNLSKNRGIEVIMGLLDLHGIQYQLECLEQKLEWLEIHEFLDIKETGKEYRFMQMMEADDITEDEYEQSKNQKISSSQNFKIKNLFSIKSLT